MRGLRSTISILLLALICATVVVGADGVETVRKLVMVNRANSMLLVGVGIVTDLDGAGDSGSTARSMLSKYLDNSRPDFEIPALATGSVALVRVSAEMPPFSRPGNTFEVAVTALGDAKSLKGGELLLCDLFDASAMEDELGVSARARGKVIVGDKILTRGKVLVGPDSGAVQMGDYLFDEVMNADGVIRLNLCRPNWKNASNIVKAINQTPSLNPYLQKSDGAANGEPLREVASSRDLGQVIVRVPEQYRENLTLYIDSILDLSVPVEWEADMPHMTESMTE